MPRPIEALIDLNALRHNLGVAREHAGTARVIAVAKADAYGHGFMRVFPAYSQADALGLLELETAVAARARGWDKPVVLLEGFFEAGELPVFSDLSLTAVVHDPGQVEMLCAASLPRPIDVHLKLNTGMNRLGLAPEAFARAAAALRASGNVGEIVAMTHFADADGAHGVDWQRERLQAATRGLSLAVSAANSAALLRHAQARCDWVRPGIMLYGASPFAEVPAERMGLHPVMTLRSRIISVQQLAAGDSVGYGCTFTARQPMRIGIVACGYGDGYPRHARHDTPVLVDGQRTGTVGLVSMDMLAVDLTALAGSGVGSAVTLWGRDLPVETVAAAAGTVSYELLCALKARVAVAVKG
jgi:alanine racemase